MKQSIIKIRLNTHTSSSPQSNDLDDSFQMEEALNKLPSEMKIRDSKKEEDIKMPLVIIDNSFARNPWQNISYSILRSLHAERSFAGQGILGSIRKRPLKLGSLARMSTDKFLSLKTLKLESKFEETGSRMQNFSGHTDDHSRFLPNFKTLIDKHNILNKSWSSSQRILNISDMPTLIDNLYKEEDVNFNFRRKSCHCSNCGCQTNLEKKVDVDLRQTSAKESITRKSTIKSTDLENVTSFSRMPASKFSRGKVKRKSKDSITSLQMIKNQNKPNQQIRSLLNSSNNMKGSTIIRKSLVIQEENELNIKDNISNLEEFGSPIVDPTNFTTFENKNLESENCSEKIESAKYMDYSSSPTKTNYSNINHKLTKLISFENEIIDERKRSSTYEFKILHQRNESDSIFSGCTTFNKSKTFTKDKEKEIHGMDIGKNIKLIYNQYSTGNFQSILVNSPSHSRTTSLKSPSNCKTEGKWNQSHPNSFNAKQIIKIIKVNSPKFINIENFARDEVKVMGLKNMKRSNNSSYMNSSDIKYLRKEQNKTNTFLIKKGKNLNRTGSSNLNFYIENNKGTKERNQLQ